MELRCKVVPTSVSSKRTKKVSKIVERDVFEEEVKSECEVEKKGDTMRLPYLPLIANERKESKKVMKKGFISQK